MAYKKSAYKKFTISHKYSHFCNSIFKFSDNLETLFISINIINIVFVWMERFDNKQVDTIDSRANLNRLLVSVRTVSFHEEWH